MNLKNEPCPCLLNDPCPNRSPNCHGQCLDYIIWAAVQAAIRESKRQQNQADLYLKERHVQIWAHSPKVRRIYG